MAWPGWQGSPCIRGHQAHSFLRKDFGQRLWLQHDHMAWPQPSLSAWDSPGIICGQRWREEAEGLAASVPRVVAAADKPRGSGDIQAGGGKMGLTYCFFYFFMMESVQHTQRQRGE